MEATRPSASLAKGNTTSILGRGWRGIETELMDWFRGDRFSLDEYPDSGDKIAHSSHGVNVTELAKHLAIRLKL